MRRFFVGAEGITEDTLALAGQDAHHIANVLRLKVGDRIEVSDGIRKVYVVELKELGKSLVTGEIISGREEEPEAIRLTVFQGLPKGKKMDFIVEKLTEIGVERIVPVEMARSVAEYDGARGAKKVERWRAIGLEAAKQSKRVTVPEVGEIVSMKQAVEMMREYEKVIVPWEDVAATAPRIIDVIANSKHVIPNEREESDASGALRSLATLGMTLENPRKDRLNQDGPRDDSLVWSVALVIGPEGGIEQAEIESMMGIGAVAVSLGKTILRTETAGLVASALILLGR